MAKARRTDAEVAADYAARARKAEERIARREAKPLLAAIAAVEALDITSRNVEVAMDALREELADKYPALAAGGKEDE